MHRVVEIDNVDDDAPFTYVRGRLVDMLAPRKVSLRWHTYLCCRSYGLLLRYYYDIRSLSCVALTGAH